MKLQHRSSFRFVALGATLAFVMGVPTAIFADSPAANASLSPPSATFTLAPGTGTTETGKTVTLPATPAIADVEIAIDTTGSMGDGIADAMSEANTIVTDVQSGTPNTDFAVVQFKDFCTTTAPTSGVGCSDPGGSPVPGDYPDYQVVQPMTSSASSVATAVGTLSASGGGDSPEDYNLVFHNSYADATNAIGWRTGSRKFVVVIGDAEPHGPLNSVDGFTSCSDQSADPHGLDTKTELAGMASNDRTLLMIDEQDPYNTTSLACYQQLAAAAFTGGAALDSGSASQLASDITTLISSAFATVSNVHLAVDSASPPPASASWITLPPALGPVAAPGTYSFGPIGINVPLGTPDGTYTFDLEALADGVDVGHETITVIVQPSTPDMHSVIQVEASPLYAGKTITISSSQLQAACASVSYETLQGGSVTDPTDSPNSISVVLDADGNATVVVNGTECVPGPDVVNATLSTSQWSINATTTLVVNPPQMTFPWQVAGYPNNEVETGNTLASGNSDLYAVFSLETSPGYAEKTATISSPQLEKRCGEGYRWESNAKTSPFVNSKTATAIVDDDGNATFVFKGASCAGGTSKVTVKVGKHTYTTEYSIDPPAVTYTGPLHKMFISASPNPVILTGDPS